MAPRKNAEDKRKQDQKLRSIYKVHKLIPP